MQLVTVGQKYQIVIPKEVRKKIKGIWPGGKVMVQTGPKGTATIKPTDKRWSDRTYGFMKDAWKGIDIDAEINKMRDEWEEKVKEAEKLFNK